MPTGRRSSHRRRLDARRCGATPASSATPTGLRRLAEDPHPLVRLIAGSALARQESRGAHQRTDFPSIDDALEQVHITLGADGEPQLSSWN